MDQESLPVSRKPKACTGGVGWGGVLLYREEANSAIPKTLNSFEGPILPPWTDRLPTCIQHKLLHTIFFFFIYFISYICFVYEINALQELIMRCNVLDNKAFSVF